MKYISALMTAASGSLRGIVASHNKGGTYFRGRTTPTNPKTAQQQAIRDAVAAVAFAWTQVLTDAQRSGWTTFAANVPIVNRMGESRNIPPMAWYNKANSIRLQAGLTRIDAAPTEYALAPLTTPAITQFNGSTNTTVTFTASDTWHTSGGALLIYASRPQNRTITTPAGLSFRLTGTILGTASSPQNIANVFGAPVTNQTTFFRAVATGADGRPSSVQQLSVTL